MPTWTVINGCYIHFSTKTFFLLLQGDIFSVGIYIFAWQLLSTSFVVEQHYMWRIRQLSSQCGSGLGIVLLWGRLVGNTLNDHNKLARKVVVIVVSWIWHGCLKDLTKLLNIFLALCKTKPSWGLTKIPELAEASAFNWKFWVKVLTALGPLCLWQYFSFEQLTTTKALNPWTMKQEHRWQWSPLWSSYN